MPKTKISEFSATPANNTDIDSINIAEGCAPSGINDAIRELMAQLKDFQVGSAGDPVTVGGVLTVQAGSASTPSLTTAGDTNTGMFFPAADTIAFAEGGAEAMRLDASGNLGLGVTPSAWSTTSSKALQIDKCSLIQIDGFDTSSLSTNAFYNGSWRYIGTAPAVRYDQYSGTHRWQIAASGTAGNAITFTQAMTLDASGNLGIGTTSPAVKVHAYSGTAMGQITADGAGSIKTGINFANGGTVYGQIYFDNNSPYDMSVFQQYSTGSLRFGTNNTERARIDSSGNLLVGTTTANLRLTVDGSTGAAFFTGDDLNHYMVVCKSKSSSSATHYQMGFLNSSGTVVGSITHNSSNTTYATSSDYRLKESIAPMTGALATVAKLKPCTYTWKSTGETGQGFIAHELQAVISDAVVGEKDAVDAEGNPKYQGIDTSFLVATLTAALQEAHGLIKNLETRISALEAK